MHDVDLISNADRYGLLGEPDRHWITTKLFIAHLDEDDDDAGPCLQSLAELIFIAAYEYEGLCKFGNSQRLKIIKC